MLVQTRPPLSIVFSSATEVFLAHTGALQVRLLLLLLHSRR